MRSASAHSLTENAGGGSQRATIEGARSVAAMLWFAGRGHEILIPPPRDVPQHLVHGGQRLGLLRGGQDAGADEAVRQAARLCGEARRELLAMADVVGAREDLAAFFRETKLVQLRLRRVGAIARGV